MSSSHVNRSYNIKYNNKTNMKINQGCTWIFFGDKAENKPAPTSPSPNSKQLYIYTNIHPLILLIVIIN